MKHPEIRTRRERGEALLTHAFLKGLVIGALVGSGLAGIALGAAAAFWMLIP